MWPQEANLRDEDQSPRVRGSRESRMVVLQVVEREDRGWEQGDGEDGTWDSLFRRWGAAGRPAAARSMGLLEEMMECSRVATESRTPFQP